MQGGLSARSLNFVTRQRILHLATIGKDLVGKAAPIESACPRATTAMRLPHMGLLLQRQVGAGCHRKASRENPRASQSLQKASCGILLLLHREDQTLRPSQMPLEWKNSQLGPKSQITSFSNACSGELRPGTRTNNLNNQQKGSDHGVEAQCG